MPVKEPPKSPRPPVRQMPSLEGLPPKKINGSSSISPDQTRAETLYTIGTFCIVLAVVLAIAGY